MPCGQGPECIDEKTAEAQLVKGSILESTAEISIAKGRPGSAKILYETAAEAYRGCDCPTGSALAIEAQTKGRYSQMLAPPYRP